MPGIRTLPGLKILLCITTGYCAGFYLPAHFSLLPIIVASIALLISVHLYRRRAYEYPLFTLSAGLCLVLFSCSIYLRYEKSTLKKEMLVSSRTPFRMALLEESKRKSSWRYLGALLDGPARGLKVYAYSRRPLPYPIGTTLQINKQVDGFDAPSNPHQFDYGSYLQRKGIYGRIFLQTEEVDSIGQASELAFLNYKWRYRLLQLLKKYLPEKERPIAQALLLGYRAEIPTSLQDKFRESGTMHLLAISGMHMGIIAWLLHLLFQRTFPYREQKKWALMGTLICLWCFLALCAFPSSGVRACFMISLYLLGRHAMKNQNTFNLLFCTASIMLLWDPGYLQDLGFLLSFSAVLGILVFYPPIYKHLSFKNKLLDSSGSLAALGISAQLGTLGLNMHYFHVFSPWFWLTGIPGALITTVNMILGIVFLLIAHLFPPAAEFTSALLTFSLSWLVKCMEWSYLLSWHHFDGIFWDRGMVISYYVMLFFLGGFIHLRNYKNLLYTLTSITALFIFYHVHQIENSRQFEICKVLGVNKPVYEISHGRQLLIVNPESVPREKIDFLMNEHRIRNDIKHITEMKEKLSVSLSTLLKNDHDTSKNRPLVYTYIEGGKREKRTISTSINELDYLSLNAQTNEKLEKAVEKMDLP